MLEVGPDPPPLSRPPWMIPTGEAFPAALARQGAYRGPRGPLVDRLRPPQRSVDRQVKVRGFRTELGEIESALSACPGIVQAVCLARDDGAGAKRLVAYVVPEPGLDPSVNEIRASLKRTLPDYMVPAAFVVLES